MAERVARVKVQATADLKGFEDASKALRDLQRAIGPTDAALEKARQEIIEFANANKRTEASIQAQINAFQKFRQQAQLGGAIYEQLGRDIEDLKRVASGSTRTLDDLGQSIRKAAGDAAKSTWQQQTRELAAFSKQAGETGKTLSQFAPKLDDRFREVSQAIDEASKQLSLLKQNSASIGNMFKGPAKGGGIFEFGRKGLADIQSFAALVQRLQEQAQSATGKVARLSEGMFALGATGVAVNQVTGALGGVAGAAERVASFGANLSAAFAQLGAGAPQYLGGLKTGLNQIALLLNQPANGIAQWSASLSSAQAKLSALSVPLDAFNTALAAIGPEGAAAAGVVAVAFAGLQDAVGRAFQAGEKEATEALRGITDETQRVLRKLAELSEAFRGAATMNELQALRSGAAARFNETPAGTDASRRAANTIANAEARIRVEGQAQADVLEQARQRYRGTTQSVDALSERLAYLQSAMKLVDQSTAEGNAEFAKFSGEAAQVKKQIDDLAKSYRTVGDAAGQAGNQIRTANESIRNNYFNRAAQRRQEEAVQGALAALAGQRPMLPAAGQTSFAGQYGPGGIGGGARMGTGAKEFPDLLGTEKVGFGATARYLGDLGNAGTTVKDGFNAASLAIGRADKALDELQKELNETLRSGSRVAEALTKLDFVDPNSINALKRRRDQIEQERNSVSMLSQEYKRLSRDLEKIGGQIERTQTGGLRGKIGYIGQGIGAAASAGVFGGPEGLVGGVGGGLIGAALGGPAGFAAGAFIGSSIGAYAGMFRQSIAAAGEFAAEVKKLEIALRGVTGSAEEFARAQQVIRLAGAELNVPVLEATKGFTQLTAAVKGAGGGVAESELVFRGVTEAIKATGGGAAEVDGALTAMAQIFSKGKVSAEELQGQLGERLPGAVTVFAQATGRRLPQLQKDLEQGVVGLNDVLKFAASLSDKYSEQAAKMASSTEDSTARMKVALDGLKVAFGAIVKPITASIQSIIAKLAEMATRSLRAVGLVKDGMAELGAVARAKDLQTRAADAYSALGSGSQSYSEKKEALRRAEALANAVLPQKSLVGVQQNVRALQQARDVVRQITADGLDKRQLDLLLNYGKALDARIAKELKLLDALKGKRNAELKKFEDPGQQKGDLDTKALEKAAREQQLLDESLAKVRIALDDAVHRNQMELIRQRYEYELELINKQRDSWVKSQTGAARGAASLISGFLGELQALNGRVLEARQNVQSATQELRSANQMSATTGGSGGGRIIEYLTGDKKSANYRADHGGSNYHEHLAFETAEQMRKAMEALQAAGIRIGSTTGGSHAAGSYHYKGQAFDVPASQVPPGQEQALSQRVRTVLAAAGFSGAGIGGKGAAARRDIAADGRASVAAADLDKMNASLALTEQQINKLRASVGEGFVLEFTDQIRQQNAAIRDSAGILALRSQLELEGRRPEYIEAEIRKAEAAQRVAQENAVARQALDALVSAQQGGTAEAQRLRDGMAANNEQLAEFKRLTDEATASQIAFNDALRFRQDTNIGAGLREGAQSYIESIGTMREATAQLAQTGIKGVEDALVSLATTGKANFQEFAASILRDTARMIIQQMVLRTIMSALGALGGGGGGGAGFGGANYSAYLGGSAFNPAAFSMGPLLAKGGVFAQNGIQPFAMGGIVNKPTLFKFANGGTGRLGLMGEAGPEAIIPLKRGRDGKLGVAGGGTTTNVTVNVDAGGSAVQGDSARSEQLGRVVSQAVQAELIKQRRPGGLLAA